MGGSSGGGGHTPYEAPDSLKSAQRLRAMGLISLGPIRGAVTPDKYESAFFDNTPLKNAQGEWNYQNTKIKYNLGTQDQLPLEGFEMSEREVPVSAEVKFDHPLSRRVIDPDITRLRITLGVNALFSQNDQGDTYGTKVDLQVLINGQYKDTFTIDGKSSSRFHRSYILDNLPPVPFTITVKRLTADSKSQRLQNSTFWSSYTEIIDTKLSYPNMAMVGIKTDSRYNPNFPNINFLLYGRLVKVPSNYDPDTRTYASGLWKGDFKLAWTNNPAWVFYDLVTNKLAGLGQRLGDYGVDKFQLYQIAQYCDQLVPDGYGGFEPRMTANLWITEQREAYQVISDMASVFRAIAVWNGVQFTAIQDRPSDPVCTYTQANVIEGKFNRQYAPLKSIFTAVEVEFADEKNFYQKAIEYVADDSMIERYGYNVKKMVAFACTSRGQARRYGKWVLETSRLEQCTINFSVGRDGLQIIPGDIIEIADKSYANLNLGGRVIAVSGRQVTLDAPIETEGESYLSYLGEDKRLVRHKILQIDRQNKALVTLDAEPIGLKPMDLWTLHTPLVSTQRYRVLTIAENDNGSYTITALQHVPQKEAIVDDGAGFELLATTTHRGLLPVTNPEISTDGSGVILNFSAPFFVGQGLTYQVRLFRNSKFYQIYDDLKEPNLAFNNLPNGDYVAEIRAKNGQGQLSEAVSKTFNINFAVSELVTVSKVFGIGLAWKNPLFAPTNSAVEIWVSSENRFETARKLVSLAYPTNSYTYDGLGIAETYYFWARMVDNINGTAGEFTPATEGITERSAEKLVDYLEGQITQSHLGKSLIDSLKADIDNAVGEEGKQRQGAVANALAQLLAETQARVKAIQDESKARTAAITAEANNRTKAIQAESASLTKKIQDEAKVRGTAVTQLQQTDAQQAQLITAVTAKADQAIAGLQEEQTARANADKAEAQARNALTTRVASVESGIAEVRQSIATTNSSIVEVSQNLNAKIDGLSIGGRNLLRDSKKLTLPQWGISGSGDVFVNNGVVKLIGNGSLRSISQQMPLLANQTVSISFLAKSNKSGRIQVRLRRRTATVTSDVSQYITIDSQDFKRYTLALNYQSIPNQTRLNFEIATYEPTGFEVEVQEPKLETGNLSTDWTPAPEDADSAISAVSADLTSYKQTQATKEQATVQQINGLTTRLANAESGISRVEKAVSDNQSSTATQLNQLSANLTKARTDLNAKITQEQTARANADKANADRITSVTSRVASAESSISNIQSTKASKTEVASLAQQSLQAVWQADAQAKVDALSVGGRNLILDSKRLITSGKVNFNVSQNIDYENIKHLAISCDVKYTNAVMATGNNKKWFRVGAECRMVFTDDSYQYLGLWKIMNDVSSSFSGRISRFVPAPAGKTIKLIDSVFIQIHDINADSISVSNPKLELGTVATDWSPAPEDTEQSVSAIAADLTEYKSAQATKERVQAESLTNLTTRLGKAEGSITNIQSSKANKDEVSNLARTALQSEWRNDVDTAKRSAISAAAIDAQNKADAAKRGAITASERAAQAKADAARAQAITSASNDATSKANAAKAQAIADAAAKDEAVKRQAAQDAQVKADNAKSQAIAEAKKLNQATSAKITNLEQTVTRQNQASATRQSQLEARLDGLQIGGRNLILKSKAFLDCGNVTFTPTDIHRSKSFGLSSEIDLTTVRQLTFSCFIRHSARPQKVSKTTGTSYYRVGGEIRVRYQDGSHQYFNCFRFRDELLNVAFEGRYSTVIAIPENKVVSHIESCVIQVMGLNASVLYVGDPKLELGTIATDWTPAPEDTDSAINAISSKVDSVQQTLITANQALGSRIDTVTASVNDAKSQVSQVSKAVSDVSGKLSATSTLKTQVIAGGRKAIAGIAIGASADNRTAESSVIVMADKFSVVKNAQDGAVKPVFSVINGRTAINGDLVADGSIIGNKIQANTQISAPIIQGGQVNIGNGTFMVNANGHMIANSGVFKGRIEATEGFFSGTVYADKIEGDIPRLCVLNPNKGATIKAVNYDRIIMLYELQNWIKSGGDNDNRGNFGSGKCTLVAKIWLNDTLIHDGTIYNGSKDVYGSSASVFKGQIVGNRGEPVRCYIYKLPKNTTAQLRYEFEILKEGHNTKGWTFGYSPAYLNIQRAGTYTIGST